MNTDFKKLLGELVSIPSISTDIAYKKDIEKAVTWISSYAKKSGMSVKVVRGFGNPIIIARTKKNPALKTILVYGHYDVQPAKIKDGWKTNPFTLTEKNGRLFGRGSADNKGQILTHLYSVSKLIKENALGYNVTFLIEGDEETGSPLLRKGLEKNIKDLECDCVIVSDGGLAEKEMPALEASFRGSCNVEVTLSTGKDDLHSGIFGGAVPNAAEELSLLISKLHDTNKRVLVPGFYAGIPKSRGAKGGSEAEIKKLTGTNKVFAKNNSEYEIKTGLEPAIEVSGMFSGYIDTGFRNGVPSKATAKINLRSAPDQKPDKLVALLSAFIKKNAPKYVDIKITKTDSAPGTSLDLSNTFAKKARETLTRVYGTNPITKYCGGTLPIVVDFKELLGVPQVMIPLANEDCGMHSASENISVGCIKKGLEFSYKFFSR